MSVCRVATKICTCLTLMDKLAFCDGWPVHADLLIPNQSVTLSLTLILEVIPQYCAYTNGIMLTGERTIFF